MSETATLQPAEGTEAAPAAPEYKPTHVLSSDPEPAEARQAEPEPAGKPEDGAEKPEQPEPAEQPDKSQEERRKKAEDERYRRLYAQRYAEKARADAAEKSAADLQERIRRLENPGQAAQPAPPDIDKLVSERAEQVVAERESRARFEKWDAAGVSEYGAETFREACATVAQIASEPQKQMLVAIATDMDGGHRAVAALAADPEEATRILAMPPHRMALALNKLAAEPAPKPPVPASRAPAPIQSPVNGRVRGEPDPNGSFDDYARWSKAQNWDRR